ncbi:LLM class flavin-dependent oxidoreductase [Natrinema soli]|uniref:LLM class flavin-dependent oxidoreductase n=1 Tax=Natrinema soli TaxID=1930624 RepID=A0ABD5SFT1_9EURY|nr:LLM class flavin-dependent oxidoreductase [Natrinema soli]
MVEEAALADRLGFDEYWVGEHHSGGHETVPLPELMLARMAEATDTIKLMPATVNLPYDIHDPFAVAERAAFLDQLCHGRLILGYGAGALMSDMIMFNADGDDQKPRMWEAVDVIETYLEAEEPTDYDGEYYSYEDRMIQFPTLQDDPVSSVAGLTSQSTYYNAVKGGHRPISISFSPMYAPDNPAAVSLKEMGEAIDEAAEDTGRDPDDVREDWCIAREIYVAESKEQAVKDIKEGAENYYQYLFDIGLTDLVKTDEEQSRDELTVEWMIENFPFIIGSPEDCIEQIEALYDEIGPFGNLVINHHDWGLPRYKWDQSLEWFAEKVMPTFQPRKGPRKYAKEQVTTYEEPTPDEDVFEI